MNQNLPKEILSTQDPEKYFTIGEGLGEGSYTSLWRATDNSTGSTVVIKKILLNDDLNDQMKKEINLIQQCQSQYIRSYYASFLKGNEVWIVKEYCEVGSIYDVMKKSNKTLTEDQISVVVKDILEGLVYLKSIGKIHRDIKASSILMNLNGEIKLKDYGISSQLDTTKIPSLVPSPYWMAPELIQQLDYDYRVDVWSLGITCVEMAESMPPFYDIHPMRVLFLVANSSTPPPTLKESQKYSNEFNDFISKCLIKNHEQRSSAEELLKHPFLLNKTNLTHDILIPLVNNVNS